jgi:hypothetical protein
MNIDIAVSNDDGNDVDGEYTGDCSGWASASASVAQEPTSYNVGNTSDKSL